MSKHKVVEYLQNGFSPFGKWFAELDAHAAAKVAIALYRMEQGNLSNVKSVGKGVLEYRIDFGPGYRIYFGQESSELIVLLGGGSKKHRAKILKKPTCFGRNTSRQKVKGDTMPVTQKFRITILNRASSDAEFRRKMLTEAVNELLSGDMEAGKAMLRDYINATITFQQLGKKLKKSSKSIHRMLGARGNPRAENLLKIIKTIQENEHITLHVEANKKAA